MAKERMVKVARTLREQKVGKQQRDKLFNFFDIFMCFGFIKTKLFYYSDPLCWLIQKGLHTKYLFLKI